MNADSNDDGVISGLGWLRRIGRPSEIIEVTFEGVRQALPSRAVFEPTIHLRPLDPACSRPTPGGYKLEVPDARKVLTIFLCDGADASDLRGEIIDHGEEPHEADT